MESGTERKASSGGSWEPYWRGMGRMESGTERKASSGGSWEPYWRAVGRMESGTEREASSGRSWEPYRRAVGRMESEIRRRRRSPQSRPLEAAGDLQNEVPSGTGGVVAPAGPSDGQVSFRPTVMESSRQFGPDLGAGEFGL
ncbi:hypothetical protein COCNU_scaffold038507G000010 [Cocos nucifera]|nr:hypothetical protein [Cocos nucifera]